MAEIDTAELRRIVTDAVKQELADRPTKAQVEVMITTRVAASINDLEARIVRDRTAQMEDLREFLTQLMKGQYELVEGKLNSFQQIFEGFQGFYQTRHADLSNSVMNMDTSIEVLTQNQTRIASQVNNINRVLFGVPGEQGPETLFSEIRILKETMRSETQIIREDINREVGVRNKRLEALEAKEAWRSSREAQIWKIVQFFATNRGIIILAIAAVLIVTAIFRIDISGGLEKLIGAFLGL